MIDLGVIMSGLELLFVETSDLYFRAGKVKVFDFLNLNWKLFKF